MAISSACPARPAPRTLTMVTPRTPRLGAICLARAVTVPHVVAVGAVLVVAAALAPVLVLVLVLALGLVLAAARAPATTVPFPTAATTRAPSSRRCHRRGEPDPRSVVCLVVCCRCRPTVHATA